jgi:hypothetical protein
MYFKTLIALGCAMFSVPAFAQESEFSRHSRLPECRGGLTRQQEPCRYLTPPPPHVPPATSYVPKDYGSADDPYKTRKHIKPPAREDLPPLGQGMSVVPSKKGVIIKKEWQWGK